MELRTAASPKDVKYYDTQRLREEFLIGDLFQPDTIKLVYSHIDRIITGSAVPVKGPLALTAGDELRAQYFCERRELGVINIGGAGRVTVDGLVVVMPQGVQLALLTAEGRLALLVRRQPQRLQVQIVWMEGKAAGDVIRIGVVPMTISGGVVDR